jgi:hypothetical protein
MIPPLVPWVLPGRGCSVGFPRSARSKAHPTLARGDRGDADRGDELTRKVDLSQWSLTQRSPSRWSLS